MSWYGDDGMGEVNEKFLDDEDDFYDGGQGFTVSMRGAPNMATVQWCRTEEAAIKKTASVWGCKESDLYIYRGREE